MKAHLKTRIAAILFVLAAAAAPAAAAEGAANPDLRLLFLDQVLYPPTYAALDAGETVIDTRLVFLDAMYYPFSYEDVPYVCDAGDCTTD